MKTAAVYEHDSYKKSLKSKIIDIRKGDRTELILEETIFYPEGGGQPADKGYLEINHSKVRVMDVQEKDEICLQIEEGKEVQIGDEVEQFIDWDFRFNNMQNHSAEHIFSGLLSKLYSANNVGFHIGKDYFTCDYDVELSRNEIEKVERQANEVIQRDIAVRSFYPSENEIAEMDYRSKKEIEGEIRITEIPGIDQCACCGTHVANSGEIGYLKLISAERYKKGIRCTLKAGMEAVNQSIEVYNIIDKIGKDFSCSMEDILDRLDKADLEKTKLIEEIKILKKEKIKSLLSEIESSNSLYLEMDLSMEEGRAFAKDLLEKVNTALLVLANNQFIIASKEGKAKEIHEKFKDDLKGGGSPMMVQGKIVQRNELGNRFYDCVEA